MAKFWLLYGEMIDLVRAKAKQVGRRKFGYTRPKEPTIKGKIQNASLTQALAEQEDPEYPN